MTGRFVVSADLIMVNHMVSNACLKYNSNITYYGRSH
jgi:hypothetical protein